MSERIPVTIWGATGFAGAELLRIFARHPHFEVIGAVSRSKAGTSVGAAHPHLRHVYNEMTFISPEEARSFRPRFRSSPCPTAPRRRRPFAGSKRASASSTFLRTSAFVARKSIKTGTA